MYIIIHTIQKNMVICCNQNLKMKYRKVYPNTGMIDPIKYICLEKLILHSMHIYLIQFIFEHNENNIKKLNKPVLCEPSMR